MRRIAVTLFGITLLLAGVAGAAEDPKAEPPRQIDAEKSRQRIVAKNLNLTEAEGKLFWPVYAAYRSERNALLARRAQLAREFRTGSVPADDVKNLEMLRGIQQLRQKESELRGAYVDRFAQVLPVGKVVRYYQIENRLEAVSNFESTRGTQIEP